MSVVESRVKMRRLLILISLAFSANAESFCPDQFTYYSGMGCFHFGNVNGGVEWSEAISYCEQLGGFQVLSFFEDPKNPAKQRHISVWVDKLFLETCLNFG